MKIIIACEFSGIVREAFRKRGHNAWSCDLIDTEIPGNHLIMDNDMHLKDTLYSKSYKWDMLIGHPPFDRLTNSVIWYIKQNNLWEEVRKAAIFFNMLLNAPIKKKCLENPIQHGYVRHHNEYNDILIPMYQQIIQPYNFGEDASKKTCLWMEGLLPLKRTLFIPPKIIKGKKIWGNQTPGGWDKELPGPDRSKNRSRTFRGIADAMADQWG
jgi:hypothetical protein